MNHTKEETTQQNRGQKSSGRKKKVIAAGIVSLCVLLAVPVLAWLYYRRSMETVAKINEPVALEIRAGDNQDIKQLELSNIDVTTDHYKEYVFCVVGHKPNMQYDLQLAHTTNIGFTYTIYSAKKVDISTDSTISYLGNYYEYSNEKPVDGRYLNEKSQDPPLANGICHDTTYKSYSYVQENAEPLYWKTDTRLTLPIETGTDDGKYINYYVLKISWTGDVQNTKETDMIYLMAKAVE